MDDEQILKIVATHNSLDAYKASDAELRKLINLVSSDKLDSERVTNNIIIGKRWVPVMETDHIFSHRLLGIPVGDKLRKFNVNEQKRILQTKFAVEQILAYCKRNPQGKTNTITFNCSRSSYAVHCGAFGDKVEVICVLMNDSIPSRLLTR